MKTNIFKFNYYSITILLLLILSTGSCQSQNDSFQKLENSSWFSNEGFAGTTYHFYKSLNNLPKTIKEIHGSGVPVVASIIYDVEIEKEKIILYNGLNLISKEKHKNITLLYDIGKGSIKTLKKRKSQRSVFNWFKSPNCKLNEISLKCLNKIAISKNKIYSNEDIENVISTK